MSCNMCYMSGYGISMSDLYDLLTEEAQDMDCFSIVDKMKDDWICGFSSPDDQYLYIRDIPPYVLSPFKSTVDLDLHFFDKLRPYLNSSVEFFDLACLLDDVFDYEYC